MLMLFEVVTVLLIITVAIFIHEMGHAVATILRNKEAKAEIFLGSSSKEKKLKLSFGRITCYLTIALWGYCQPLSSKDSPPITHKQRIIFLLGGPIASLMGGAALFFSLNSFQG